MNTFVYAAAIIGSLGTGAALTAAAVLAALQGHRRHLYLYLAAIATNWCHIVFLALRQLWPTAVSLSAEIILLVVVLTVVHRNLRHTTAIIDAITADLNRHSTR